MTHKLAKACYLARVLGMDDCDGLLDAAHMCPKQRIKHVLAYRGYTKDDMGPIVWDPRVTLPVCRRHHHKWDNGFIRLKEDQYPQKMRDWAAEYGFYYAGQRDGWKGEHNEPRTAA